MISKYKDPHFDRLKDIRNLQKTCRLVLLRNYILLRWYLSLSRSIVSSAIRLPTIYVHESNLIVLFARAPLRVPRWGGHLLPDVGLLTHSSHSGLNIWSLDINGGWSDNRNIILGGPTDHERSSDTIIEIMVVHNTTPQNRFVSWELPLLINTLSDHLLSNVGLWTNYDFRTPYIHIKNHSKLLHEQTPFSNMCHLFPLLFIWSFLPTILDNIFIVLWQCELELREVVQLDQGAQSNELVFFFFVFNKLNDKRIK